MSQVIQVRRPQGAAPKDKGILGTGMSAQDALAAAGIVGAVAAAPFTGGLSLGTVAGAGGLGAMTGGLIDRANAPKASASAPEVGVLNQSGGASAISRRLDRIAADNGSTQNYDALVAAEKATSKLPERERQAYQPVLTQARLLEEQRLKAYYG